METVTVSRKYQIVIPEKLREAAKIKPGGQNGRNRQARNPRVRSHAPVEADKRDDSRARYERLARQGRTILISVDSYGWIERLTNGPKASKYNKVIDDADPSDMVTSVVVLYEVYKKVKKIKGEESALEASAALNQTKIIAIDQTLSI